MPWIACKDRLPTEPGWYLVCFAPGTWQDSAIVTDCYCSPDVGWLPEEGKGGSITHWQPLPLSPYDSPAA